MDAFPGKCPRCGFGMTYVTVPGDISATPPRKATVLVSCTENPRGCPYPTETLAQVVERRYYAGRSAS